MESHDSPMPADFNQQCFLRFFFSAKTQGLELSQIGNPRVDKALDVTNNARVRISFDMAGYHYDIVWQLQRTMSHKPSLGIHHPKTLHPRHIKIQNYQRVEAACSYAYGRHEIQTHIQSVHCSSWPPSPAIASSYCMSSKVSLSFYKTLRRHPTW